MAIGPLLTLIYSVNRVIDVMILDLDGVLAPLDLNRQLSREREKGKNLLLKVYLDNFQFTKFQLFILYISFGQNTIGKKRSWLVTPPTKQANTYLRNVSCRHTLRHLTVKLAKTKGNFHLVLSHQNMAGFADKFDQDVDPAAEFLAREQDELAGLEDEVRPAANSIPNLNSDDPTNSASSFEMVEGVDQDGMGIKKEDEPYPDIDNDDFRGASSSPPTVRDVREEPEKIKTWRLEQVKRLEEKDEQEEKKKLELREIAKKELEDWYINHEEAIAKTKAANRNAEKQFVAEDDEIEPGTEWERIAKLCDFNPKAKQGSKDVTRMRSIVLQLKQSPIPINNKA